MSEFKNNKNIIHGSSIEVKGNMQVGDNITNNYYGEPSKKETTGEINKNRLAAEARKLIAKGKVAAAIELLLKSTEKEAEDLHSELIQLSQKWSDLKKEKRMGILMGESASVRNSQIVASLLEVVKALKNKNQLKK